MIVFCKFLAISTEILNVILADERARKYNATIQVQSNENRQGYVISTFSLNKDISISFSKSTGKENISVYSHSFLSRTVKQKYFKQDEVKQTVDYIFSLLEEFNEQ